MPTPATAAAAAAAAPPLGHRRAPPLTDTPALSLCPLPHACHTHHTVSMEDVKGVALNGASDDGVEEAVELVEEAPVQAEGSGGGPAPPADDDEDDGGALPVKGTSPPAAAAEDDEAGEATAPVKAAPLEIKQQKQPAHGSRASPATSNPLGAPKAAFMSSAGGVNPDAELVRASDPLDEVRARGWAAWVGGWRGWLAWVVGVGVGVGTWISTSDSKLGAPSSRCCDLRAITTTLAHTHRHHHRTPPQVRSSPVRVTDLSKQLKEQFESGGSATNDAARQGEAQASRSASGAALTQHDLVNTANVALVSSGAVVCGGAVDAVTVAKQQQQQRKQPLWCCSEAKYGSAHAHRLLVPPFNSLHSTPGAAGGRVQAAPRHRRGALRPAEGAAAGGWAGRVAQGGGGGGGG